MNKKILYIITGIVTLISLGITTSSAYSIPNQYAPLNTPFVSDADMTADQGINTLNFILQLIAGALIYFAAPLAILMLVISGVTMIVSGSDTEKAGAAKKHITWTIIGLIVIILSYAIVRSVIDLTIKGTEIPAATGGSGETN